jgi:gliding motility-associated-like protein
LTKQTSNNTASVINLDLANPAGSEKVVDFDPTFIFHGLTASPDANYLYALHNFINADLYRISLLDGSTEFVCQINPPGHTGWFPNFVGPLEYNLVPPSEAYIDLDCDDSSGATGADFNSIPFNCNSDGSSIIDIDPVIRSDALIDQMTIEITSPIPDAPFEILETTVNVPTINIVGIGTNMLTLTNLGNATLQDFLDQLAFVIYRNTTIYMTPGFRTVEVQFTSELGSMSNVAKAFIEVVDLPHFEFDLGPDIDACEGTEVTLTAIPPGTEYLWSTGDESESITVTEAGLFYVTVSTSNLCPGKDSIDVNFIPNIQVSLQGDYGLCPGENIHLLLTTDSPFPITVTVSPDPGSPFLFEEFMGTLQFVDSPSGNTEYYITEVVPSQPACITIVDDEQIVDLWPAYTGILDSAAICAGESILLVNDYYDTPGTYPIMFNSIHGCDSLVEYTISFLPAEHLYFSSTTCDPSSAGVFFSFLSNANGCDTVVETMVQLLSTDTTQLTTLSCQLSATGIFIDSFTNFFGCDSLVVTTVNYAAPTDTTELIQYTCDSAQVTTFLTLLTTNAGCDSLVLQKISLTTNDTTLVNTSSCDSADLGLFVKVFPVTNSCDSVVITTVQYSLADSIFLSSNTCDPGSVGVFTSSYSNQFGCDSFVIETVSLLPSSQFTYSSSSCNPADTGIFILQLVNQFGCDSIIITHITLLPSNATFINSKTCDFQQAGQFVFTFQNQFGCDSIVTETITYLAPDTTILTKFTCDSLATGVVETFLQNQSGCDSLILDITALYSLPMVDIHSQFDYNGFDISCYGALDGGIIASTIAESPIQYQWSNGSSGDSLINLAQGLYFLNITDGNGCRASDEITLTEPSLLSIHLEVSEPDCFQNGLGIIEAEATGGVAPYQYALDNANYESIPIFTNLGEGVYSVNVLDANGCVAFELIAVNVPVPVNVSLGDNQVIDFGDTTTLLAVVNVPFTMLQTIQWNGIDSLPCPNCLEQIIVPFITTSYEIEVMNDDGCSDKDDVIVTVNKNEDIFVPNIFSPNGDGINDEILVYAGSYVRTIREFSIFDRWGNNVFSANDFTPHPSQPHWNGNFKGKSMNPGVYAYHLIAELYDYRQVVRYGDITLVR